MSPAYLRGENFLADTPTFPFLAFYLGKKSWIKREVPGLSLFPIPAIIPKSEINFGPYIIASTYMYFWLCVESMHYVDDVEKHALHKFQLCNLWWWFGLH